MEEIKEQGKEEDKHEDNNHEKWITLTNGGKDVKYLAKLLKGTNVKMAYKTSNIVLWRKSCQTRKIGENDKFNSSGIHQLICSD